MIWRQLRPVIIALIIVLLAFSLAMVLPTGAYNERVDYCEDHPSECTP